MYRLSDEGWARKRQCLTVAEFPKPKLKQRERKSKHKTQNKRNIYELDSSQSRTGADNISNTVQLRKVAIQVLASISVAFCNHEGKESH
jgi:hypothetical protein